MKPSLKIFVSCIALFGIILVFPYAFHEPQSFVGNIYLKSLYDPQEANLLTVSEHLEETNGRYIPKRFDKFLFKRLLEAEKNSTEYNNIIGFYADQAICSRAGSIIFEEGQIFLPSIISIGRHAPTQEQQQAYLFLAYGIANKQQAYKPAFFSSESIDQNFDYIETDRTELVGIESP